MKSALLGVACFVLAWSATSCGIFGPDQSVILDVAEVNAPASIALGASLSVALTVVTGGCRSFNHIETSRNASRADITVWGRDASKGRSDIMCPLDLRHEPHSVQFDPPFASTFTVTVIQGSAAPRTVVVRVE